MEVDSFGAGDLHDGAVQGGVCDQPHHPLGDQRRPAEKQSVSEQHVHTPAHVSDPSPTTGLQE